MIGYNDKQKYIIKLYGHDIIAKKILYSKLKKIIKIIKLLSSIMEFK